MDFHSIFGEMMSPEERAEAEERRQKAAMEYESSAKQYKDLLINGSPEVIESLFYVASMASISPASFGRICGEITMALEMRGYCIRCFKPLEECVQVGCSDG